VLLPTATSSRAKDGRAVREVAIYSSSATAAGTAAPAAAAACACCYRVAAAATGVGDAHAVHVYKQNMTCLLPNLEDLAAHACI
jgi:hypothetical protein